MSELKQQQQVGSNHPLEQFILLAKSAKGAAVVALIKQVLEAPGVYVFGELLEMPHIQELADGPNASYLNVLNLFAFGTYNEYIATTSKYPELTVVQKAKLRHLTIVSLAAKTKCISYSILLKELDLKNVRELEDLIIDCIYADVIRAKLDQNNQQLEVDYAIGRDIRPENISHIVKVLGEWCDGCETVLSGIEQQITHANTYKENCIKTKQRIETEVGNIKKTLKATSADIDDQHMSTDSREVEPQPQKATKKTSKVKGLRGSGKFWQKSSQS
ncbi:COP9 signalosome complex subunit 7b-like [Saccoglossus kowalevskii]|uniref:COP9 signalosome complex subunit 7b-like n=1 Tax=Saccoglossus kowalevskii TaxID=10224 RepID=A0ABM0GZ41_SACKO|nr:PREDICTED: COP9 signalosome complex subunit 7b-like [Saccoglossus kowalevskii]